MTGRPKMTYDELMKELRRQWERRVAGDEPL